MGEKGRMTERGEEEEAEAVMMTGRGGDTIEIVGMKEAERGEEGMIVIGTMKGETQTDEEEGMKGAKMRGGERGGKSMEGDGMETMTIVGEASKEGGDTRLVLLAPLRVVVVHLQRVTVITNIHALHRFISPPLLYHKNNRAGCWVCCIHLSTVMLASMPFLLKRPACKKSQKCWL